ncbi:hypothetical protein [uncultured Catenibacterium sp.]|uniref:hypothetical protein n=1 Tax=uncultured Catenibacterium sp. TaxID=286142 RepID=UPI0025D14892|nr:hypothetical protein [uncultured Catenibacterium sp.]
MKRNNKISHNYSKYINNNIALNVIVVILYLLFYDFIYRYFVCAIFNEPYYPMDSYGYLKLLLLGGFPILFYKGLINIASVFSIFTYILAYIPFNETLAVGGWENQYSNYRIVFFVSMCLFFASDSFELNSAVFKRKTIFRYSTFRKVSYMLLILVVLLNLSNLHLTNFLEDRGDLYDLRANLKVVGGTPVVYLIYWFKNIILPILLVSSLIRKEKLHVFIVFTGCIIMFMIDQQKITFIVPFAILILYLIYEKKRLFFRNSFHNFILLILIIVPFLCFQFKDVSDIAFELAAILIYRTQCIEGQELNTYFRFFGYDGLHPYTYYSHIGMVNMFTNSYPYGDVPIGQVVTQGGSNANGMFWLMDGIAAGGIYGCIIISIIFLVFKSFFNGIKYRCSPELFAVFSLFAMSMTMNVSLFTALFSCGLLLLYLLFIFVDFNFLEK